MKNFIAILLFTFIQSTDFPTGTWEYIPDKSQVEIINKDGKLFGSLISSRNPDRISEKNIIKNMEYREGQWLGEFYLYEKKEWVDANFELKGNLLLIEYTYGFLTTNLRFHKIK